MRLFTSLLLTSALTMGALLSGCSNNTPATPTAADIEKAITNGMTQAMEQAKSMPGGEAMSQAMAKVEIKSVKILACQPDDAKLGVNCNIETEVNTPFAGLKTTARTVHMIKGSDGWVIAE
jgi:hypothetical protein